MLICVNSHQCSFLQDGKIEAEVKLTGILSLGALQPGETRKYGTTIAPGLYAPVHQHFFVARMDMAVDCKPGETFNQVIGLMFSVSLFTWLYLLQFVAYHSLILIHFLAISVMFDSIFFLKNNEHKLLPGACYLGTWVTFDGYCILKVFGFHGFSVWGFF